MLKLEIDKQKALNEVSKGRVSGLTDAQLDDILAEHIGRNKN